MTSSLKSVGAITLFVEELERSKTFYGDVFGLPVHFEDHNSVVFKFDNLLINLLQVQAANDLIGPATVGGPEGGSRFQFTIWVVDVDAVCSELGKRGVPLLNGPFDRAWGMRTASFQDPDGHIWEVAEALPQV
jgi:lactoylglutathione lyase